MSNFRITPVLLLVISASASAQFTSGDIRALPLPDQMIPAGQFSPCIVGSNRELYFRDGPTTTTIEVFADVDAFMAGATAVRSIVLNELATYANMTWVDGKIYGNRDGPNAQLGIWDPMTGGAPQLSTLRSGANDMGWGGPDTSIVDCDGNFIFNHHDAVVDVYDLQENLLRTASYLDLGLMTGGFAAGGYYYGVRYNGQGQSTITMRVEGATGASTTWQDSIYSMGCGYLTHFSFDIYDNVLLHAGAMSPPCGQQIFRYNDVLPPGPSIIDVMAVPTVVSPGQAGAPVTMQVENLAMDILDVSVVDLTFTDAGGMDVTAQYTVTPDPGNPPSIAIGGIETFNFTVDVGPGAAFGVVTLDGMIETTERVSGVLRLGAGARTTDTWDVMGASPQIRTVDAVPARVAPGGVGFVVTATVENVGLNGLDVQAARLTFKDAGATDRTGDYNVTPDPANPPSIGMGATETFSFAVDVLPQATLGVMTIDAEIDTLDQISMAVVSDFASDLTDSWEVLSAIIEIRTVDAPAATVSQGGTGYDLMLTVENAGLNSVLVTSVGFTFSGMVDRTAEYMVTPAPGNPSVVPSGVTESFSFTVDVDALASMETITIDAGFAGADLVSGGLLIDVDADVTDSWDVIGCGAPLCGDCTGDGVVTILDALAAAQHSAGLIALMSTAFTSCNVTGAVEPDPGAVITIIDALTLAQFAAGLPATLVCC